MRLIYFNILTEMVWRHREPAATAVKASSACWLGTADLYKTPWAITFIISHDKNNNKGIMLRCNIKTISASLTWHLVLSVCWRLIGFVQQLFIRQLHSAGPTRIQSLCFSGVSLFALTLDGQLTHQTLNSPPAATKVCMMMENVFPQLKMLL